MFSMRLVEAQVSHVVANVTKKNFKSSTAELHQVHCATQCRCVVIVRDTVDPSFLCIAVVAAISCPDL